MAKRLKSSNLLMAQVDAGRAPKQDTLAGFYGNVSRGQTAAVQKKASETTEATRGLAGALDLDQTVGDDGKVSTTLKADSKFRSNVSEVPGGSAPATGTGGAVVSADTIQGGAGSDNISAGTGGTATPATGTGGKVKIPGQVAVPTLSGKTDLTSLQADEAAIAAAITAAGGSVQEWKDSGASAAEYINKLNQENAKAAGEAAKEAQERLTEKKLGARGQASELEQQAQSYQNIIASEPGTSNIKALANLTKFYDMSKYGALESGIRQGELALARQEAQSDLASQQSAESQRAAAIAEYGKQAKELGGILQSDVEAANEEERKRIADYFKTGLETAEGIEGTLKTSLDDISGKRKNKEKEAEDQAKEFKESADNLLKPGGAFQTMSDDRKTRFENAKSLLAVISDTKDSWWKSNWEGISKDEGILKSIRDDMAKLRESQERYEIALRDAVETGNYEEFQRLKRDLETETQVAFVNFDNKFKELTPTVRQYI